MHMLAWSKCINFEAFNNEHYSKILIMGRICNAYINMEKMSYFFTI